MCSKTGRGRLLRDGFVRPGLPGKVQKRQLRSGPGWDPKSAGLGQAQWEFLCDVVCGAARGRLMRLVVKSFLGSGKSSKIGRGHLSGEASEAKNWMFGMLGKRSKVRWGYGCLSAERRRYDVRGRGVRGAPLFPGRGQYVKLHSVRLNVARHSNVEIGFLGKVVECLP